MNDGEDDPVTFWLAIRIWIARRVIDAHLLRNRVADAISRSRGR